MGHREQLLEGARRCLIERGYARTTARDIVAASGTNLASIGYHFGSKENLLVQAMIQATGEWGDEVERVLAQAADASPMRRLELIWTGLTDSLRTQRDLWIASIEIFQVAERVPEVRGQLGDAYEMARFGFASLVLGLPFEEVDEDTARAVGSLVLSTVPGLLIQWTLDPQRAPTGTQMAKGLRRIVDLIAAAPEDESPKK